MSPTNNSVEDTVEEAANRYFKHKFNWPQILKHQGCKDEFVKKIGTNGRSWLKNFDKNLLGL